MKNPLKKLIPKLPLPDQMILIVGVLCTLMGAALTVIIYTIINWK